jgi:hypothetical protein
MIYPLQLRTMDWTVLVIAVVAGGAAYIGAYWGERGKIRAQTKALEEIVRQETKKAFGQETAKQEAIAANLQNLDLQMRTLTTTQEQIKGVWLPCWTNLRKSDRTSCRSVAKGGRCDGEDGD